MADDAYAFITALGFSTVDVFSFSLGGMVAQALVLKHPDLVRKLILTGTGPAGGKDIDKVAGTTYYDTLRATLTRKDPKEFLFFNRDDVGKRAAHAFVERLEGTNRRTGTRRSASRPSRLNSRRSNGGDAPHPPICPTITQPTLIANGDNDRMVPSVLSEDMHRRIAGFRTHHLSELRARRHLPIPSRIRFCSNRIPRPLATHLVEFLAGPQEFVRR